MLEIHPPEVTAWQLPEDATTARVAFIDIFTNPSETWLRAYAFTMADLAEDIIAAHQKGVPMHLYLDRSQEVGTYEKPLVEKVVAAGVEVTIGTSPAGTKYIAHEKGGCTADGDCFEGSTNFSDSAWEQVNTLLQFNSPEWAQMTVDAFNRAVVYAWTSERSLQLMSTQPEPHDIAPTGVRDLTTHGPVVGS